MDWGGENRELLDSFLLAHSPLNSPFPTFIFVRKCVGAVGWWGQRGLYSRAHKPKNGIVPRMWIVCDERAVGGGPAGIVANLRTQSFIQFPVLCVH
jgi:hypothetical protein